MADKLLEAYRGFGVRGQKLVLAVSGGADSTAMLLGTAQIARALPLALVVASLDHGLRAESEREVERVRGLSADLGISFQARKLRLVDGPGLEGRARQARYRALEEIRTETGSDWIATAHTASDQAETLLMRLLRGASLGGASGVRPRLGRLIRPLLSCTRADVERFLSTTGISFAVDPMNGDFRFTRARIRAQLIPAIESIAGPEAVRHLAAFASSAASDAELLDGLASAAHARLLVSPGRLDAAGLRALPAALRRRVVAQLLREAGADVDRPALGRALAAISVSGRATLSRGFELRAAGGLVRCAAAGGGKAPHAPVRLTRGWVDDSASGLRIGIADELPAASREGEWLEIGAVPLPLSIRRRQPGDRVRSSKGAAGAKVQDLMVNLGIPSEERDSIPIVCDAAGRILWVVGVWPRGRRPVPWVGRPGRFLLVERISAPPSAGVSGSL